MSQAMVTNGLCILTIIAIFHALIQSDHPENFLGGDGGGGGGGTRGTRSTTVLPLQILRQDVFDKVLPLALQNPYPWNVRWSIPLHPLWICASL